jgi:hypothetical protein
MKFVVTINRETFRRNPNAGKTSTLVSGIKTAILTAYGPRCNVGENLEEGWMLVDCRSEGGVPSQSTYVCSGDGALKKLLEVLLKNGVDSDQIRYDINQRVCKVDRSSEPEFIFEYNDIEISCRRCESRFPISKLESDYVVYGDGISGDAFSDSICPKCGEWDCCDLEYEKPEEVAKELGL